MASVSSVMADIWQVSLAAVRCMQPRGPSYQQPRTSSCLQVTSPVLQSGKAMLLMSSGEGNIRDSNDPHGRAHGDNIVQGTPVPQWDAVFATLFDRLAHLHEMEGETLLRRGERPSSSTAITTTVSHFLVHEPFSSGTQAQPSIEVYDLVAPRPTPIPQEGMLLLLRTATQRNKQRPVPPFPCSSQQM